MLCDYESAKDAEGGNGSHIFVLCISIMETPGTDPIKPTSRSAFQNNQIVN